MTAKATTALLLIALQAFTAAVPLRVVWAGASAGRSAAESSASASASGSGNPHAACGCCPVTVARSCHCCPPPASGLAVEPAAAPSVDPTEKDRVPVLSACSCRGEAATPPNGPPTIVPASDPPLTGHAPTGPAVPCDDSRPAAPAAPAEPPPPRPAA